MLEQILEWDWNTLLYLNNSTIGSYEVFWSTVTGFHNWIPLYALFVILLLIKSPRREAMLQLLVLSGLVVFIGLLTYYTKITVARLRPNNIEEIDALIRVSLCPTDYSFFSGHASGSFSITVFVFMLLRKKIKWALLFFIWPILFALSRIYVGVHFPSDIIVGAAIGCLSGLGFYALYRRFIVPDSALNHPVQEG